MRQGPKEVGVMPRSIVALLVEARRLLMLSQGELGEKLGASRRTGQRWGREGHGPWPEQLHALARLVHPHSPDLAASIAKEGGTTLEALGIGLPPPQPPPPPPAPALPDPVHIVDTVVCAAADAVQLLPDAIRPALRAAFKRARLVGLTVEDVEAALGPDGPRAKSARST